MSKLDPRDDRIPIAVALICAIATLGITCFLLGANSQNRKFIAACEGGTTFWNLGETDTPYRCTRVIDHPPTTTETP